MQEWLNAYLTERGVRHVHRGNVIVAPPCGSPYKAVLHAVAVDGLYESSPEIVTQVLADTLCQANALGARTVALTAIATGYGRMPMSEFAVGLREILSNDFPSVERVIIALRSPTDTQELLKLVPELESIVDRSKQFGNAEP
jgi:O-acetyl-ADP-ribose deacetylase (regulator of RNase III)